MNEKKRSRPKSSGENEFIGGKIPPQNRDSEVAVLGAIMLEKSAIFKVVDKLQPEFFYIDAHQLLYQVCRTLYLNRSAIDIITVTDQARKDGVLDAIGGAYYITSLTNKISSSANIEFHAMIVLEQYLKREIIRTSAENINNAYEDDANIHESLERAFEDLYRLHSIILGVSGTPTFEVILHKTIKDLEARANSETGLSGLPTGSDKINAKTGGWQRGELIVIAARPAMGKTARVLNFLKHTAQLGGKTLFFSLEMTAVELVKRLISEQGHIRGDKLKSGVLENDDWVMINNAVDELSRLGISLIDKPFLSWPDILTLSRMQKVRYGLDLICIDYLQLIKVLDAKGKTRDVQLGEITGNLKQLAKELQVPVILLSQLSREVERKSDKRPELSHLRESGNIEQDADVVCALYRPSYYFDQDRQSEEYYASMTPSTYKRASEFIILKQRNGDAGISIQELFFGEYSRFEDGGNNDFE